MKSRGPILFAGLMVFLLTVNLACATLTGTPTPRPQPTNPPPPTSAPLQPTKSIELPTQEPIQQQPTLAPTAGSNSNPSSGGLTTFTDKNNYYQIQVPSDWAYSNNEGQYYYIDQFKSPDEKALVENIAYDDGTPFTGTQNGRFALQLLNKFYSSTGKAGDIRVSDDQIMQDGSERLRWRSQAGGYSGISYFEIRNKNTFLMITIEWVDSAKDQYFDTLNNVILSYVVP